MPVPHAFLEQVRAARAAYDLPAGARAQADAIIARALGLLFPHFAGDAGRDEGSIEREYHLLLDQLRDFLGPAAAQGADVHAIVERFGGMLGGIREALLLDARATAEGDPAARGVDEVILAYPGFHALACYRLAHALDELGVPLLPRLITEAAHRDTGVDIHPGATLGRSLAIDHGTGIVIGESAVIGDRVRLYQGVTLGALTVQKRYASTKRHPTIESDVVIYANATILGGDTVIGAGSIIGGNVWITRSVPPRSVVTHAAAVERRRQDDDLLEFNI